MKKAKDNRLRSKVVQLRILAFRKGLVTNRDIARACRVHEDLISKAFKGKRVAALKRIERCLKNYRSV